jgi:hypothetical protein
LSVDPEGGRGRKRRQRRYWRGRGFGRCEWRYRREDALREDRDKGELREQEVISLIGIGDPLQRLEHGISERSLLYRQQILSLEQEEEGLGEVHVQQGALD